MTRTQHETDKIETDWTAIATPPSPRQASSAKRRRQSEHDDTPAVSTEASKAGKPTAITPAGAPAGRQTKKAVLIALLKNPHGASLSELMAATDWQSHSIRAALTGLRKEGHVITRYKDDNGKTRYRSVGEV